MYIVIFTVTRQRNAIVGDELLTLKELFDAPQQRREKLPLVRAPHTTTECGGPLVWWLTLLYFHDAVRAKF